MAEVRCFKQSNLFFFFWNNCFMCIVHPFVSFSHRYRKPELRNSGNKEQKTWEFKTSRHWELESSLKTVLLISKGQAAVTVQQNPQANGWSHNPCVSTPTQVQSSVTKALNVKMSTGKTFTKKIKRGLEWVFESWAQTIRKSYKVSKVP